MNFYDNLYLAKLIKFLNVARRSGKREGVRKDISIPPGNVLINGWEGGGRRGRPLYCHANYTLGKEGKSNIKRPVEIDTAYSRKCFVKALFVAPTLMFSRSRCKKAASALSKVSRMSFSFNRKSMPQYH